MTKQHIPLEEIKKIPSLCINCGKEFKNVYSMSAHKGHCTGQNNTDHLATVRAWNKGKLLYSVENVLSKESNFSTQYVKKFILQKGLKVYKCEKCQISDWCGSKIILELDHIDGCSDNNELQNLRLLCPNCHSQTDTFRGRNINKGIETVNDADLFEAIRTTSSIREALIEVGLSPKGGNYARCYKLLLKNNLLKNNQ